MGLPSKLFISARFWAASAGVTVLRWSRTSKSPACSSMGIWKPIVRSRRVTLFCYDRMITSIGSRLDARSAGRIPDRMPHTKAKPVLWISVLTGICRPIPVNPFKNHRMILVAEMPQMLPSIQMITASVRYRSRILDRGSPSALQMPISQLRASMV